MGLYLTGEEGERKRKRKKKEGRRGGRKGKKERKKERLGHSDDQNIFLIYIWSSQFLAHSS